MKKNLLFAGLLLAALPICAQKEGPTFSASDPYPIFEQTFEFEAAAGMSEEDAFKAWQQQEIGRIDSVQYYIHKKESGDNLGTNAKPWEKRDEWQRGPWRDTTLILRNDVMVADNPTDSNAMRFDSWSLVSQDRSQELAKYGVTGGKKFFQYVSTDTAGAISNSSAWSGHKAARYRRNLFVRGIDIQDTTSYRFTAYVTAHKDGELSNKPTLYADVMRGHFASEKPFTMGVIDKSDEYKYNRKFEKDVVFEPVDAKNAVNKQDEWSKVTFMTYYINDSVADDYVFVDGYWWDAEWSWTSEETGGEEWNYIVQPDKYFVRIGFASDSTTFGIDDISLTKSWIGGCEYNGDKIRVDFGYKTNLSDLCEQAYDRTNISSIEILGDYFEVWGLLDLAQYDESYDGDRIWYEIPIRSAEYQKDGYMYMFTDTDEDLFGGEYVDFNVFDSVLVSFKNPVDQPEKKLVYDEKSSFPRAWDVEWIKAGRNVMGFTNEPATPNPAVGEGIWSMKDLPPVFQGGFTYESGSFQMDGSLRSLDFKFSRNIAYDDRGDASDLALMKVQYGNAVELWTVSSVLNDTIVEFERPAKFTEPLAGDVEFTAIQLFGASKNDHTQIVTAQGEDATISYSFGDLPKTEGLVAKVTFEKQKKSKEKSKEITLDGFSMSNSYMCINEFAEGSVFTKGLTFGVSAALGTGAGAGKRPTLNYSFNVPAQGDYDFELQYVAHHGSSPLGVAVYNEAGEKVSNLEDIAQKTKFSEEKVIDSVDVLNFTLEGLAAGSYKLSMVMTASEDGWYMPSWGMYGNSDCVTLFSLGIIESGKELPASLSISYPYTSAFAAAQINLNGAIAKAAADESQFGGEAYTEGKKVAGTYADFNNPIVTAPSRWTAATKALTSAKGAIDARIALVDEMWKQYGLLGDTLSYFAGVDAGLVEMGSYKSAQADFDKFAALNASEISDDSIKALTEIFKADQAEIVAQYAVIDTYRTALQVAIDSLESDAAIKTFGQYAKLEAAVKDMESFDEINASSQEIKDMQTRLTVEVFLYADEYNFDQVNRMYIDTLASLCTADMSAYEALIAERLAERNYDALAAIYKAEIKSELYAKILAGEDGDSLPMSALIKNANLHANFKIVERMDKQMPANQGDLSVDPNGANIQHVRHQYNDNGNMPIWIMILENDYTDLLPGWTARANNSGSNKMVTVSNSDSYSEFTSTNGFFNGSIAMDWTSKATLTQTLEDLPAGYYSIGVNLLANCGKSTALDVTADKSYHADFAADITGNNGIDSVLIGGEATIKLTLTSESGWSRADDFYMVFRGQKMDENYALAKQSVDEQLNGYLTEADGPVADAVKVEYKTLDGILVDAPQEGKLYVRTMYFANEEPISEKVIFK